MNKLVTAWLKLDSETEQFEHNHISSGYDSNQHQPIPNCEHQRKCWANAKWVSYPATIKDGKLKYYDELIAEGAK